MKIVSIFFTIVLFVFFAVACSTPPKNKSCHSATIGNPVCATSPSCHKHSGPTSRPRPSNTPLGTPIPAPSPKPSCPCPTATPCLINCADGTPVPGKTPSIESITPAPMR